MAAGGCNSVAAVGRPWLFAWRVAVIAALLGPVCSGEQKVFIFKKLNEQIQCAVTGRPDGDSAAVSPAILWNQVTPTYRSEFMYQPTVDPLICQPHTQGCNVTATSWTPLDPIARSLPPLDDYRWEDLETMVLGTELPQGTDIKHLPVNASWAAGISYIQQDDAYIILCGDNKMTACYWILFNGWPEHEVASAIRYCRGNFPYRDCRGRDNTLVSRKGRVGEYFQWVHVWITWEDPQGCLTVFLQEDYLSYTEFLRYCFPRRQDHLAGSPQLIHPQFLTMFTIDRPGMLKGLWKYHKYSAQGVVVPLATAPALLVSRPFKPVTADPSYCTAFFHLVRPGWQLQVVLSPAEDVTQSDTLLTIGPADSKPEVWREARLDIPSIHFRNKSVEYVLTFVGSPTAGGDRVGADGDHVGVAVSHVRECDPTGGDVRVSSIDLDVYRGGPQFACYLKGRLGWLNFEPPNDYDSTQPDILEAGNLCLRVNKDTAVRSCEGRVLCSNRYCGCPPGFWGENCITYCGKGRYLNQYGPGCQSSCGNCSGFYWQGQTCNPMDGECPVCNDLELRPPLCQTRLLKMVNGPLLLAANSSTIELKFDLEHLQGKGTLAGFRLRYRMLTPTVGDEVVTDYTLEAVKVGSAVLNVTSLPPAAQVEVCGAPLDDHAMGFCSPNVTFNTASTPEDQRRPSTLASTPFHPDRSSWMASSASSWPCGVVTTSTDDLVNTVPTATTEEAVGGTHDPLLNASPSSTSHSIGFTSDNQDPNLLLNASPSSTSHSIGFTSNDQDPDPLLNASPFSTSHSLVWPSDDHELDNSVPSYHPPDGNLLDNNVLPSGEPYDPPGQRPSRSAPSPEAEALTSGTTADQSGGVVIVLAIIITALFHRRHLSKRAVPRNDYRSSLRAR